MSNGKGLHFKVIDRTKFEPDLLAGVFVAHGCHPFKARELAKTVDATGEYKTTVIQAINLSMLRGGISQLGTIVIEIAPRRA